MSPLVDPILMSGPTLIGSQIAFLLFGAFLVQLYSYVTSDSTVKRPINIIVAIVTIADLLSILIICHHSWHTLVQSGFTRLTVTAPISTILNAILAMCFQGVFSWRIYSLRSNLIHTTAALLAPILSLIQFGSSIATCVKFAMVSNDVEGMHNVAVPLGLHLVSGLMCDTLICTCMISMLTKYQQQTRIKPTKLILRKLAINTMENGIAITVVAAINLVVFYARPYDAIHISIHLILGRIYANAILATLNNRQNLRETSNEPVLSLPEQTSIKFTTISVPSNTATLPGLSYHPNPNSQIVQLSSIPKDEETASFGGVIGQRHCEKRTEGDVIQYPKPAGGRGLSKGKEKL